MVPLRQCDFLLLRYVPDVVRNEPVNIGIILLEEGDLGFSDVRFVRDWRRVRCASPDVDIALLESFEEELRRLLQSRRLEIINYRGPMSRRDWILAEMGKSFSGALQLASMNAVLTESPQAQLALLAQEYLEPANRGRRVPTGRRVIYHAMRDAFDAAGVWRFMRRDISVAQYTRPGDPLKIDCGYRPNGVIHMFHALSLATNVDSAKVLAFSYSEMREGLMNAEHAMSDLKVITEDELDPHDEEVAFALATLEQHEITIAHVAEMPQIAERARIDLKP